MEARRPGHQFPSSALCSFKGCCDARFTARLQKTRLEMLCNGSILFDLAFEALASVARKVAQHYDFVKGDKSAKVGRKHFGSADRVVDVRRPVLMRLQVNKDVTKAHA